MKARPRCEFDIDDIPAGTPRVGMGLPQGTAYLRAKRITDVLLSLLAILVLLPVLVLVGLLIKLDSRGPVIFAQERVGYDRTARRLQTFRMYKFRTMFHGSDQTPHRDFVTAQILGAQRPSKVASGLPGSAVFHKMTNDRRVTRVGHVLRLTTMDELPQLLNVLRGDMSLVGPRPALPYEVAAYRPWHMRRLEATPGCTGLWQVSGWCTLDFEQMVRLDLLYISQQSYGLDIEILLRTLPAIVARHGER